MKKTLKKPKKERTINNVVLYEGHGGGGTTYKYLCG